MAEEAAETITEKAAETITEEAAEKAAETEEAVAEVAAETVAEEMSENVIEQVAETEIVAMKVAETKEVVKRKGQNCSKWVMGIKKLQWAKIGFLNWSKLANLVKMSQWA